MKLINNFFINYINNLHKKISKVDIKKLDLATKEIYKIIKKGGTFMFVAMEALQQYLITISVIF